ncbi:MULTISPECIES: hypothetical protein [unclassified Bradyrhizobium]
MATPKEQLTQIDRDIEAVRTDLVDAFDEHRLACEAQLHERLELREELLKRVSTDN